MACLASTLLMLLGACMAWFSVALELAWIGLHDGLALLASTAKQHKKLLHAACMKWTRDVIIVLCTVVHVCGTKP